MAIAGHTRRMIRRFFTSTVLAGAQAFSLVGCNSAGVPRAPMGADLMAETRRGDQPTGPEGACWASDETPAIIQTVTEQIAEDPTEQSEGRYRTETRQEIVRPRETIWFRTPCAAELTPEVVATLQRALSARGLYVQPASGVIDIPTKSAIRAFQVPRGLNSDQLSLTAAQELGVIAQEFDLVETGQ